MYNFHEPKPLKGSYYNGTKDWWDFLKHLWRKYKMARLNDDLQTQFNVATAIRIVQGDGGCKLSGFPEFNITQESKSENNG